MESPDGRWLEYLPLDDLKPDPRNPKEHADAELDASLDRFGYTEPVSVDERTGLLSAGHGRRERLIAARDADREPPDGIRVDDEGRWLVPVNRGWSSRDDAEAAAYLVASNRLTERGGWHDEGLAAILEELAAGDKLEGVGYSAAEVEDLVKSLQPTSLEGLADRYGQPDEADLWPVLRFQVSPETRDRYLKLVAGKKTRGDDDLFVFLLDAAEKA